MPLSVALLFHFNQHFNEYAALASRACYRGLLNVLRSHPTLKFNIHISGTLIDALKWLDSSPLDLIRDGLAAGQFELLGSTYAQNIPYASDDWDNAQQIALHRATLKDTFGVEPTAFWNAERCWRQSLVPVIADGGYRCTLVEDHILREAGATDSFVFTTHAESKALTVVTDDERLKHKFNLGAWFGRNDQVIRYLRGLAAKPESATMCAAYAEDAEAMGLWGWEAGLTPNQTWAHLDRLLTALEAEPEVKLIKLSEAPRPKADLTPIPDGSAAWMNASLAKKGAPYHEDGYTDWLDFNRRSPKLAHFRQTYSIIRAKLLALNEVTPASQALRRAALYAFCAHQYEFGCIGVGGLNDRGWENARTAVAVALAAKLAEAPSENVLIDDCNGDGSDEVLVCDGKQLMITSAYGGRLLYWFDLTTGQQFVGNQLPVIQAAYEGDGHYPVVEPRRKPWLPDSFAPQDSAEQIEETPPTRLGRFLPDWVWEGEPLPMQVAVAPKPEGESFMPLFGQTRGFSDHIIVDSGNQEEPPHEWLDSRLEKNGVAFIRYLSDELTIEKSLRFAHGKVAAAYTVRNHDTRERSVRLRVTNELCPDYAEVIRGGRGALAFLDGEAPGVTNTRTGASIVLNSSRAWQSLERREDFCALTIGLTYDFTLSPRSEQKFELKLGRK
ncbi:MAG: hypothetical protein HYZ49_07100 [Chloroflexi bacterium]|nr:hypothetical protein [Chloroflexota bacterium]